VQFQDRGKNIKLQGVAANSMALSEISATNLLKSYKGNDVWALAVLNFVSSVPSEVLSELQLLLQEFEDVFARPKSLPPQRVYDHTIPLLPSAVPVNSKPYKYSPKHKDEIEKQVQELLGAGPISHSTSPFASLVLLVQKKMVAGVSVWIIEN
jgi:hypothetical protein